MTPRGLPFQNILYGLFLDGYVKYIPQMWEIFHLARPKKTMLGVTILLHESDDIFLIKFPAALLQWAVMESGYAPHWHV